MKKKVTAVLALALAVNGFAVPPRAAQAQPSYSHDIPIEWISHAKSGVDENVRVIVQLQPSASLERVEAQFLAYEGVKIRKEYDVVFNGFSAQVPFSYIPVLSQIPGVEHLTQTTQYYESMASSKALTQALDAAAEYGNNGEGIVVSIVDSGVDVEHPAFATLADPSKAKIPQSEVFPFGGENTDTHFSLKIPYGYNFADDSYFVKGLESNHGVHVAGIVGANDTTEKLAAKEGVAGVASQVQLLAMKVFSNDPEGGGAHDDDIIAAIESSIEHKADIINLSLGSESGFKNDNNPMQRAINVAAQKGVLVVAAGGNETAAYAQSTDSAEVQNFFDRNDNGLIGSPSTASGALSVASYENTNKFVYHLSFASQGQDHAIAYNHSQGDLPAAPVAMVSVGMGRESDYTEDVVAALQGKFALISRGEITFVKKLQLAQQHGAIGILVYNNKPREEFNMSLSGTDKNFFAASLTQEQGQEILAALGADAEQQFVFDQKARQVENEDKGQMSAFTSWGTTSSLDFKPEVSGVGGQVYSTDNDAKYTMMSGTSMASPHVAGVSAIVLSQLQKDLPGVSDYASFVKKTLMNTAQTIKPEGSDIPYSVRRQGSGLVQTGNAIKSRVLATYGDAQGASAGELRSFTGTKNFDVYVHNYGTKEVSFNIDPGKVYTTFTQDNVLKEALSAARLSTSENSVSLQPNEGKTISFSLDASAVQDQFVEGFIEFASQDADQPNIHFAYMGFAGDWNKESIFDTLDVTENNGDTYYSDTQLVSMVKDPLNIFDQGKIFTLGVPFGEEDPDVNPTASKVAFSPNGDGFADVIIPQIGMLRSAEHMEINILDENKKPIKHLYELEGVRKQSLRNYLSRVEKGLLFTTYPYAEGMWDGMVYNPKSGENEVVEDGQYYMQVRARLGEGYDYQELLFPVKIDSTTPQIEIVQDQGKDYALTEEGRVVTFTVTDDTGLGTVYAKLNGERMPATDLGNNTYSVVIPYSSHVSEKLEIIANDTALNEVRKTLDNIGGNSLTLNDFKPYIQTKISSFLGISYSGTTELANSASIAFEFVSQKDGSITTGRDNPVRNKRFTFASAPVPEQGKYTAYAIEKDASGAVIKKTSLGDFVYDYKRPSLKKFEYAEKITDKAEQKNPLNKTYASYVEYAMQLNADGTATYRGIVQDNVFDPQELTLTIGLRTNKVPINPDGSFEYVLKNPSAHYDFVNVSQPTSLGGEEGASSLLDSLDLASLFTGTKKEKRLESTYVVSKYLPYTGEVPEKEFSLSLGKSFILGEASLDPQESNPVIERDGKYYFKIDGFTSQDGSLVFIDGVAADTNATIDGGTHFSREVEIVEGLTTVNVRVNDKLGAMQADVKVRILFDRNLPSLELTSPSEDDMEEGLLEDDEQNVEDIYFIDTFEDHIIFAGKISDAGFGYTLKINDEFVVDARGEDGIPGTSPYGANEKEFSKKVEVEDGDILSLYMEDTNGNAFLQRYVVRKLDVPRITLVNKQAEEALAGVGAEILDAEGQKVYEFTSGTEAQEIELKPGTYTYHETVTPEGLSPHADFNFTVAKDGTITLDEQADGRLAHEKVLEVSSKPIEYVLQLDPQEKAVEGYTTEAYRVFFTDGAQGSEVVPGDEREITVSLNQLDPDKLEVFRVDESGALIPVQNVTVQGNKAVFRTQVWGLYVFANKIPEPPATTDPSAPLDEVEVNPGTTTGGTDGDTSTPGTNPGSNPGTTTPAVPGTNPGTTPGTTSPVAPGTNPGTTPGTTLPVAPGTNPGVAPGLVPSLPVPGVVPGTLVPGTNPGTLPGMVAPGTTNPGATSGSVAAPNPAAPGSQAHKAVEAAKAQAEGVSLARDNAHRRGFKLGLPGFSVGSAKTQDAPRASDEPADKTADKAQADKGADSASKAADSSASKAEDKKPSKSDAPKSEGHEEPQGFNWLLPILGVLALGLAGLLFFVAKRKKDQDEA